MPDEIEDIESSETRQPSKLFMLAVLILSIAAVSVPILITRTMLYDEYGISKNTLLTHLVFCGVWSAVILLAIALIVKTHIVRDPDIIWYRWTRSEVILVILLILIVPLLYGTMGVLMQKLGLPIREELFLGKEQQGLAFFVILTILRSIVCPVIEEIFWRGYVQRTLERIFGGFTACMVQAIPFAAYHFAPLGGFLLLFLFGFTMGAWRWRRRTLIPIILAHIAINSLYCAARWPDWLEMSQIKMTHDYATEFIELSKPDDYDPNDDAREDYKQAIQLVVEFPEELRETRWSYPTQWSKEEREQAEAWVVSNMEALKYVEKGAKKSCYWMEYEQDGNLMMAVFPSDLAEIRHLAYALCIRAKLRVNQGELEQGFSDVMCCYQLGKHHMANKALITQLVAYGVFDLSIQTAQMILAHEEIEFMLLTRIQKQFETFAESDKIGLDFTDEKFVLLDEIQRLFTDDGRGGGHIPKCAFKKQMLPGGEFNSSIGILASIAESDIHAWRKLERRQTTSQVEKYCDLVEKASSMSPWQYNKNDNRLKTEIELIKKSNPLINLLVPAHDRVMHISARAPAQSDATIAILGLLRYKADTGQFPENLSQLVTANYLKAVTNDPYSDGPMVYKRTDDGFILYSFGADFDDDSGTPNKWGYGEEGGDQVFWPVEESSCQH